MNKWLQLSPECGRRRKESNGRAVYKTQLTTGGTAQMQCRKFCAVLFWNVATAGVAGVKWRLIKGIESVNKLGKQSPCSHVLSHIFLLNKTFLYILIRKKYTASKYN